MGPEFDNQTGDQDGPPVERGLSNFAFTREEQGGEVRLTIRDAPAAEIARSFRASGALFVTLMGETGPPGHIRESNPSRSTARGSRNNNVPSGTVSGEATLRYFYRLAETLYVVSVTLSSGLGESIAHVYPSAAPLESDVASRTKIVIKPA